MSLTKDVAPATCQIALEYVPGFNARPPPVRDPGNGLAPR